MSCAKDPLRVIYTSMSLLWASVGVQTEGRCLAFVAKAKVVQHRAVIIILGDGWQICNL